MPLPQANLDTRRFDDLVAEARGLIPRYAPEWTNHNASDPGITLIELLAWVTEATLYRLNRVPEGVALEFAKLLLGHVENEESRRQPLAERIGAVYLSYIESGQETDARKRLEAIVGHAIKLFNEPYRAVTELDFAREAKRSAPASVARVRVISDGGAGQVVVVVVPAAGREPDSALLQQVKKHLDARRLVGTRVIVRGPRYTSIALEIKAVVETNTRHDAVEKKIRDAVERYLDPLGGGRDGAGWPFGRPVSAFELYHLIEAIEGIDHVESIVTNEDARAAEVAVSDLPDLKSLDIGLLP